MNYNDPTQRDTTTYKAELCVTVTYTYTTEIEAASELDARTAIDEDSRNLIERTVLSGERENVEFTIDYLSDGSD